MRTKIIPVTDFRRQTSAVIREVQEAGDVVYITQHGRPAAVLLGYEEYEALRESAKAQGWPVGYFTETYGATEDETLERPAQGEYEQRETVE